MHRCKLQVSYQYSSQQISYDTYVIRVDTDTPAKESSSLQDKLCQILDRVPATIYQQGAPSNPQLLKPCRPWNSKVDR